MPKPIPSLFALGIAAAIALVGCAKPTPSVSVSDQAIVNDTVTIAKVVSAGPDAHPLRDAAYGRREGRHL